MRTTRTTRVAALAALIAAAVLVPPAEAAMPASRLSEARIGTLSASLTKELGTSRTAGSYVDAAGRLVIPVTDAAAMRTVRAAGATPRLVAHSSAELSAAQATVDRTAAVPGTARAVDPVTNKMVITVDATVTGRKLATVRAAAAKLGSLVTIERIKGHLRQKVRGGDLAYYGDYECSVGFNVNDGTYYYFVTAGHCGVNATTWYSNYAETTKIGPTIYATYPGKDMALVQYTNTSLTHAGTLNLHTGTQTISSAATPTAGTTVYKTGGVSGVSSGTVTSTGASVTYDDGDKVTGLIKTSVCADPGDSGSPLYKSTVGYGVLSGGDGTCEDSDPVGPNYFYPLTKILSAYGVSLN